MREVQHEIVTGDSTPIRQAACLVLFKLKDKMVWIVDEKVKDIVVKESANPWASPVVLMKKRYGELRFCVNYKRVNAVTDKDVFSLPSIDYLLDQ